MPGPEHATGTLDADWTAPAESGASITPSDSTDLPGGACRAIWVGGDGNISIVTPGGATVVYSGAKAGSVLPARAKRVKATGTTATSLVAMY